jgi:hypothetical protein
MLVSRLLFSVAVAVFATAAVASGLDRLSENAPSLERLVPGPFRAQADRSAATTTLDRKDNAAALITSRDAVASDPVDPASTASLGSALLVVGRTDDAERTFRVAAKFGWRNVRTQAFWYDVALQGGDYGVAAERLDALLRVHPRLVDQTELLKPMESDPAARKALVARMRMAPPWLDEYLKVADDTPSDVIDRRLATLADLRTAGSELGCETVAPFTDVLLDNGRRHDAETLWNGNCPSLKVTGLIADPSFAQVLVTTAKNPFSWRVISSGDLSIRQVSAGGKAGGIIVSNSAPGTRLALVQTVALPAGRYRFQASPVDGSQKGGKLYLSWGCNQRPPFPDTTSGDLLGGGQEIEVSDCDRQQIGIWVGGGGASAGLKSIALQKIG